MFKEYTIEQFNKWNEIVYSFKDTDIYYTANYVKSLELNGDGKAILIHYKKNDIEAINVVIKKDISKYVIFNNEIESNKYFDYTTPYGYGGFIFKEKYNSDIIQKVYEDYTQYCKNKNIITEFTRFNPLLKNYKFMENLTDVIELGPTVTISLTNYQEAWNNYESKNRNVIRKAIRRNVEIEHGFSKELMEKFKKIYIETMTRIKSNEYYFFSNTYFDSLYEDMKDKAIIFYATYENEIISMAYVMFHGNYMHYHLSGTSIKYRNLASTNLLIDQIIKYGHENGYKKLHLGGGVGAKEDSLFKFKRGFKKDNFTTYKIGKTIFNKEKYDELRERYKLENDYFPAYAKES